MKKIMLLMVISFAVGALQAQRIATTPLQPTAADKLLNQANAVIAKALATAENNTQAGCSMMTKFGGSLGAVLGEENKPVAAAQCCDHWKKNGDDKEHPKAYYSLCGTPKSLKEYLGDAAKFAIAQPAVRCPAAAQLGAQAGKLPQEEREKLCKACGSRWPNGSKAKFAVCGMQGEELPKGMKLEDLDFPEDEQEVAAMQDELIADLD